MRKRWIYDANLSDMSFKKRVAESAAAGGRRSLHFISRHHSHCTSWLSKVREFYRSPAVSNLQFARKADARPFLRKGLTHLLDNHIQLRPSRYQNTCTADGSRHPVCQETDVRVKLDTIVKTLSALIVPSLPIELILGVDFCELFEVHIDFSKKTCTPGNSINARVELQTLVNETADASVVKQDIIDAFREISGQKLGRTDRMSLTIDTGDAAPFRQYQYPLSPHLQKILNQEVDEMLKLDVIESSTSPYCSPVLLVRKAQGEYRFCFDGRRLNEVTKHDSYPLPRIDRILSLLRDAQYISSLDLRKAFWQIPLAEGSREKTALAVQGRGLFQFKVVPFGLRNSAQTQQGLMAPFPAHNLNLTSSSIPTISLLRLRTSRVIARY
jgi:hypothetical protein